MDTQLTTEETISHIDYVFHSLCLRSADDVTIHYTARYNFDSGTWKMTSDSLDIDFIHSDIRDRSCKNLNISYVNHCFVFSDAFWQTMWKAKCDCKGVDFSWNTTMETF